MSRAEYQRAWVKKNKAKWTAYNTAKIKEYRLKRLAEGLCVSCGAHKPKKGNTICDLCIKRSNSHRKPKS